jgi:glycosyltransferase involved in cell wall biosynthesis
MRPLRILHVAPVLGQGGAERLLVALAGQKDATQGLEGIAPEQHIVAVMQPGQFHASESVETIDLGFDFSRPVAALLRLLPAIARLRAIIAERQIDVVQGWLYYGNMLTLGLSASGKPIIWSVHNSTLPGVMKKPALTLCNWILMQTSATLPAAIAYCASDARQVHEQQGYFRAKGRVIPNGVDVERFKPNLMPPAMARAQLGLPTDGFMVGLFGRYDPQKNIQGCLEAFARFAAGRTDSRLVLAGRGMEIGNAALSADIARQGLTARVTCLGPVAEMTLAYSAVDMVMLGSAYGEAMPLVLLEALACHTPIASTMLGDIGTLPVPAHALVPVGDMTALADAMAQVASTPQPDPAWEACYVNVRASFSMARYTAAHSALYREVADPRGTEVPGHG